jgi:hypothetical protein
MPADFCVNLCISRKNLGDVLPRLGTVTPRRGRENLCAVMCCSVILLLSVSAALWINETLSLYLAFYNRLYRVRSSGTALKVESGSCLMRLPVDKASCRSRRESSTPL